MLATNTVFIVLNRRMRIRTYGGVRGVGVLPAYSILFVFMQNTGTFVSADYPFPQLLFTRKSVRDSKLITAEQCFYPLIFQNKFRESEYFSFTDGYRHANVETEASL